jgi:DNA-binding transcriptional LysR family regulator
MEIRQLNALLAVAEHGTFSAAADALDTVQSNVSSHIARLEKELDAVLFDRAQGGLTQEGEAVIRRARRAMSELEAAKADVAAFRHEVVGDVRIGLIGTTARWLVPQLLDLMSERFPKTHLRVSEGTTSVLEPQLNVGALDLAIVLLPVPSPELVTEPLFDEEMLLVVSHDHHLAQHDQVDLTDLVDVPLLLPPVGTAQRAEIDAAAANVGVTLKAKAEIDGVRLTASLVFDGHGPSILPATSLPGYLREQWKLIYVEGLPRRRVGLARQRRSYPSAPARALRGVLNEVVATRTELHPGLHLSDRARIATLRSGNS